MRCLGVLGVRRDTPGGTDLSTSSVNNRWKDAGVELRVLGGTPISARAFPMRVIAKLFILHGDAASTAYVPVWPEPSADDVLKAAVQALGVTNR